jgi:fermentation-respiration switch protein FrsA (DUF1100 family)
VFKINIIVAVVILLIIVLFCISVIISYNLFDMATRRYPKKKLDNNNEDAEKIWNKYKPVIEEGKNWIISKKPEEISITSYDGLKLVGYLLLNEKPRNKYLIMMHGYRAQELNDFAASAKYFYEDGYNLVFPDERSHGKSEGQYICFGIKERFDCKSWIEYIINRFGNDSIIMLMGVSMGCATVNMTLGFDLPSNVKGVIADCGYTSPRNIFAHVIKDSLHMPLFPFINMSGWFCKKIAGFGIDDYSTLSAFKDNKIPVLFIHGNKDDFVPIEMSYKNYDACKAPKDILIIDNAPHAMSFLYDTEKCWNKIKEFLDKYESK